MGDEVTIKAAPIEISTGVQESSDGELAFHLYKHVDGLYYGGCTLDGFRVVKHPTEESAIAAFNTHRESSHG